MFSEISAGVKIALGAAGGAVATFLVFTALNHFLRLPAAEQRGRDLERTELTAATTKASGELSNEADQAQVNRRLCRERGRVKSTRRVSASKEALSSTARAIIGTSLIGARGKTPKDQDAIDDTVAGVCGARVWTVQECRAHDEFSAGGGF